MFADFEHGWLDYAHSVLTFFWRVDVVVNTTYFSLERARRAPPPPIFILPLWPLLITVSSFEDLTVSLHSHKTEHSKLCKEHKINHLS